MSHLTNATRRIAAGDWVRVRGEDPSIRGVGKVIEGSYAPEDDALVAAHVEVGPRRFWIAPGDIDRIGPQDEARLSRVALDRGLVPAARATALEARLATFARECAGFVRTPGLLDALWAASSVADPDHGSAALTTFLVEEALGALAPIEATSDDVAPPDDAPPALLERLAGLDRVQLDLVADRCGVELGDWPSSNGDRSLRARIAAQANLDDVELALRPPIPPSARAPVPPERVLPRALEVANLATLRDVARRCEVALPVASGDTDRDMAAAIAAILGAEPPIDRVLGALSPDQLGVTFAALIPRHRLRDKDAERLRNPIVLRGTLAYLATQR